MSTKGALGTQFPIPSTVFEAVKAALALLTKRDRLRYRLVVVAQMVTSILDLAGVLLIGLVGVLAANSVQQTPPPEPVQSAAAALGLSGASTETLAGITAAVAAAFLISKSVLSTLLMRRVFRFLGNRQASVSTQLTKRLFGQPLLNIERRPSQETAFALSEGVSMAITTILGSLAVVLSEFTLLLLLSAALFIVNPAMTLVAIVYFGVVGFGLQFALRGWAGRIGQTLASTWILGQKHLQEAIVSFREVSVFGRRSLYVTGISSLWQRGGAAMGDQMFIGQLPKVGYETALVAGAIGMAAWQFAVSTPAEAVAMLALFLAAGSRVVPSMLRLNGLTLAIRTAVASASVLFSMIRDLPAASQTHIPHLDVRELQHSRNEAYPGFVPSIEITDASVTYPRATTPALVEINLVVPPGSRVALAGSTGAGKSTLADVMLGVLQPTQGSVLVSGLSVDEAIALWPGSIAYVPQNVAMVNGTVRENIALGLPEESIEDEDVWRALKQANLDTFLSSARDGLDTLIGERGVRLSGGQRQRLGLARALYSKPKLLVLDEATSALDAETEMLVADALAALDETVTTVTVAHRLAPIRHSDIVVFLEAGRIHAAGTFDEVRKQSPAFDRQATLLGL